MMQRSVVLFCIACLSLYLAACASQATPPAVDSIGTVAAELAFGMQTQTAAARSANPPTMTASNTPPPTLTPEPTKDPTKDIITVVNYTGCYYGPGANWPLQSHINVPKDVILLGIGNVDGWYVISGPYFYSACWVSAADVQIDADVDLSRFPVMTPGH